MPRKIRQLKAELRQVGAYQTSQEGSHTKWKHPAPQIIIILSGHDGDDAKLYQEKAVREFLITNFEGKTGDSAMSQKHLHYSMVIEWSDEDQAYLVILPEWADSVLMPATHGSTYSEAVQHALEVLEMLVNSATKNGEPLPPPKIYV